MSGISIILDMAARALAAEQLGVEVSSHNITNVNTPGYSRQRLNLETAYPVLFPWGSQGQGVRVQGIDRAFDPFIAARLTEKTSFLSDFQARQDGLENVAAIFNETRGDGLSDTLSGFWAAWQDLADNPSGTAERQVLLSQSQMVAAGFNSRSQQLVDERLSLSQQVGPLLEEINSRAAHLAQLNVQIQEMETTGEAANDLRDQRQQEVDGLARLIGVHTYTTGEGHLNVTLPNGAPLVQGSRAFSLRAELTPFDTITIIWQGPNGTQEDLTAALQGGKLTALLEMRDRLIPDYQGSLDRLARELVAAVNRQHAQGVGLSLFTEVTGTYAVDDPANPLVNNPGLPFGDHIVSGSSFTIQVENAAGALAARGQITMGGATSLNDLVTALNNFFTANGLSPAISAQVSANRLEITVNSGGYRFGFAQDDSSGLMALGVNTFFSGDRAADLTVNATLLANPDLLAAGQLEADGSHAPGDNRNALALADLETAPVGPDLLTFGEAYRRLVTEVGLETAQSGQEAKFYQETVEQLTQMRDAVSAVSLDEELSNLIKYQRAYQAAARLVSVADELYQTLLSLRR